MMQQVGNMSGRIIIEQEPITIWHYLLETLPYYVTDNKSVSAFNNA